MSETFEVTMASDCSGIDTPVLAFRELQKECPGVSLRQAWYSDICPHARRVAIQNGCKAERLYEDILARDNTDLPKDVTVYVAGAPCQPFSKIGQKKGSDDARFGVFRKVLETIELTRPESFLLENVLIRDKKALGCIDEHLDELSRAYEIHRLVLVSTDFGLPQRRQRMYWVGLRSDVAREPFQVEDLKSESPGIVSFLGVQGEVDAIETAKARRFQNVTDYQSRVIAKCVSQIPCEDPWSQPWIINAGSSLSYLSKGYDCCITLTRRTQPYLTSIGRMLTGVECGRLQGLPRDFNWQGVSETRRRNLVGNAMSLPVIKALLTGILRSLGKLQPPPPEEHATRDVSETESAT